MAAKKHHTTQARITAILVSALAGCTTPPSFIPEWTVTWTEWNWSRPGATQSQLNTEFAAIAQDTGATAAPVDHSRADDRCYISTMSNCSW